jgi:hypothetical protein
LDIEKVGQMAMLMVAQMVASWVAMKVVYSAET